MFTLSFIKDISIIVGGIVTLFMFINGLLEFMRQGKQRRVDHFIMLRRRLKENPDFEEICNYLHDDNESLSSLPAQNKRDFLGLIEEVALLKNSKLIKEEVAYYMFGFYAIKCIESKNFWKNIEITENDKYWSLFFDFAKRAKKHDRVFKIKKNMIKF